MSQLTEKEFLFDRKVQEQLPVLFPVDFENIVIGQNKIEEVLDDRRSKIWRGNKD
jgi:hypothetical protein